MLTKKIFFLCVLTIVVVKSYGQVNLQTGSAVFSLPMFNWQDNKSRLNSVVALSYNSGNGLKVNDIASNVGQGWNLIAGGVITRMQVGEPDDQVASGSTSETDINKYPNGILYATVPATNGCPVALKNYPIYGWENQLYAQHNIIAEDKQLDYFNFQFNGKAGMFVLDLNHSGEGEFLGDTKMKVTYEVDPNLINSGIRSRITSFTIQDVDGLKYKFSKYGISKLLQVNFCDPTFNEIRNQPKFKSDHVYYQASFDITPVNPWVISSWYLEEIEDPFVLSGHTPRKIIFNYEPVPRNIDAYTGEEIIYNADKNCSIVARKRSITKTPVLSSITYPDGHVVSFNPGANRFDLNGEKILSSVDVSYQGRYLSKYLLKTSYFIKNRYGTPVNDYQKSIARLCLLSVQKIGVDLKEDTPPYIFDYYVGAGGDDFVPPAFSYVKDIWGYYNGDYSQGFGDEAIDFNLSSVATLSVSGDGNAKLKGLCFLNHTNSSGQAVLRAKPGYAKNGLLRQIIYPTGGTLTYDYEQNRGKFYGEATGGIINVGGVHVSKTSSTDGGNSNGCNTAIATQYKYILNAQEDPSLWGSERPVNWMSTANHYQPEYKDYHWTLSSFPFGECYYHFRYPGIMSQYQAMNVSTFQEIMNVISPILNIISIATTIMDVITVATGGNPVALIIDVIIGEVTLIYSCAGTQSKDNNSTMYYNYDMNGVSPLPAQFKRVEVTESPGGIGKTVQVFTSDDDYQPWVMSNPYFSSKQRFAPWAYGLPKLTTVYDVTGTNKIKETENFYSFNETSCYHSKSAAVPPTCPPKIKAPLNLKSTKCLVTKSYSQRNTNWINPSTTYQTVSDADLKVDTYDLYTGRLELTSTVEKVYKPNDDTKWVATTTNYIYNSISNFEPNQITTTQSNGDVNYKIIKYSSDYSGGALTTLVQNNIVSLPVSTVAGVVKGGAGSMQILSEKVTEFTQIGNNDIKPSRILEQRFAQPLPAASFTYYQGPGSNTANYKIVQSFTYDGSGNLISIKDEGSRQVTNIYDYDDKYVVASIINAEPVVDKPAYTSFETNIFGGWTLTGSVSYNTTTAVTGSRSFTLSSGKNLSASLYTAKPYTLSLWASNSFTVSSGATLTKSAPTINGFTYYEYDIAQGTSSISVSGNVTIDELRLYPKTARMSSITYDPIIGKTSECDANNRITYYEYDNLGRLRLIKDDYRNILKMYEYNNVSAAKQNGCPGLYYNHVITELFTRNNCTPGHAGNTITYTVAANMFSSALSQADADAQAENYLLTNGQNYVNNDPNSRCDSIYYNTQQSKVFITQNCDVGYVGGQVTYTVLANKYSSMISQADANDKALDEIEANGQAYANSPAHKVCTLNSELDWVGVEGSTPYCATVGGNPTPHLFIQQVNVNPNSPSYGQTRWWDAGPQDACPQICDFTIYSGYTKAYGSINTNGSNTISFILAFYSTSGTANWSTSNQVATITGGCWPTVTRTLTITNTSDGRTWEVIITNGGAVSVRLVSGTAPTGTNSVGIIGSFQL